MKEEHNIKGSINKEVEPLNKLGQNQNMENHEQSCLKMNIPKIFKCEKINIKKQDEKLSINSCDNNENMKKNIELIKEEYDNDDSFIPHNIPKPKAVYGQINFNSINSNSFLKKHFSDNLNQRERYCEPSNIVNNNLELISTNFFNKTDVSNFCDPYSQLKMNLINYHQSKNYRKCFRDILLRPQPSFSLNISSNFNFSRSDCLNSSQNIFRLSASPIPSDMNQNINRKNDSLKAREDFYNLVNKEYQSYLQKRNVSLNLPILTIKEEFCYKPKF